MLKKNESNFYSMNEISLADLANKHQTPLYVYSADQIRKNIQHLQSVLGKYFDSYRIQYAVKANTNPHVLKIVKETGIGADCSSPLELRLAKQAGFPMDRSTYTGNYESPEDFKRAIESGVNLNLDDYHRIHDLKEMGILPEFISFRINPGIGRGGFEQIVTGGADAKFGFPYEETRKAYQTAIEAGVKRFGIHMMTGSNILEPFYFAEITQKIFTIIENSINDLGIELEFINIGGGLGVPYTKDEESLDLDQSFKMVSEVFKKNLPNLNIGNPEIALEPGRYLVANSGVLLSKVTHVKRSYRNYVGIDAGMSTLLRPAMYKAFHDVKMDGKEEFLSNDPNDHYRICGQICENSDIHPLDRCFKQPKAGDLILIENAGAYGFTMSSNYNNRVRPAEILLDGDSETVIRTRETEEDVLKNVPEFELK
ncbi:MAG: diaminopimelate decarboxylase [Bdellovibrionota bacterium]|nr:diaminopimelate decarboxylase [Bdellovibrionota bacterium]